MIRVHAVQANPRLVRVDLLTAFFFEDRESFRSQVKRLNEIIGGPIVPRRGSPFGGKERETLFLFPRGTRSRALLLVGLGKSAEFSGERIRRAAAAAAKAAAACSARTAALIAPEAETCARLVRRPSEDTWETFAAAAAEGIILGSYAFKKYIRRDHDSPRPPDRFVLLADSPSRRRSMDRGASRATVVCEATCLARDLENEPGNSIYPRTLANAARRAGRRSGFHVTVLGEKAIRRLNMGGLLSVAQGSHKPPRFLIMEYRGRKRLRHPTVLVGKGVTFDSGGISIKPSADMSEMKMDMSGAAAVIGTMQAAAKLGLGVWLVGLVPATENLPGGSALKPGDIIRHQNGLTSEVDNTDAEGRLILADALAYAARYSPELVIDIATLTGAVVIALGHVASGMMGNDDQTMRLLQEAGERTYERVWQLPLFDEYDKLIRSEVADVKNVGGRWAGAITAALFLKRFIGSYKWVHLDIAGTAIIEEPSDYTPRGGSGTGVRLLTEFLRRRASKH
jgi:leucyl aminopeptidase